MQTTLGKQEFGLLLIPLVIQDSRLKGKMPPDPESSLSFPSPPKKAHRHRVGQGRGYINWLYIFLTAALRIVWFRVTLELDPSFHTVRF